MNQPQNDPEAGAPNIDSPEEAANMPVRKVSANGNNITDSKTSDSSASSSASSSTDSKGTRLNAMESKMDQMSKEIQMLQMEKAEIKAENQKLLQRMDDVQLGQLKQVHRSRDEPHAILIADSHHVLNEKEESQAPPRTSNKRNKLLMVCVICCLVVLAAVTFGIVNTLQEGNKTMPPPPVIDFQPSSDATNMPTHPPLTTISSDPSISFAVDQVQEEGRVFTVPADTFPISIEVGPENPTSRTTIRLWNSRNQVVKGVMLELVDTPTTSIGRQSSNSQNAIVRGYYNPKEYTKANDFLPGDELVAVDYEPFVVDITTNDNTTPHPSCARHEDFEILQVDDDLGWNANPETIRIGRLGVVGSWYEDFEYTFDVGDVSVESLWTDAVDIPIEYTHCHSQEEENDPDCSFATWQPLLPDRDHPSLRYFSSPVSGTVRILFKGASFTNLNGLVTHRDGGGLHVTFCSDQGMGIPLTTVPTSSPTTKATMDRYAEATNALYRGAGIYYPLGDALDWLTQVDTYVPTRDFEWVERYALVRFFHEMNGDAWSKKNRWKTPGLYVCSWQGVSCNNNGAVIELDLRNAGLSGTLPHELMHLLSLKRLKFQNDLLAEDGSIPTVISQLSNLKVLFMRNCGVNKIGPEVSVMSNLENLMLRGNRFYSPIPSDLFSLTKLTSLNLKECALQDQIPSGISSLTNLEVLDVSVSLLQAPFPQELSLLPKLRRLVAGTNQWSTTIPTWFSQMSALEQLYLAKSNMQGTIPSEISQMTSLTFLTFNQNQFTGTIPQLPISLTNCNMKNNQFSDVTNKGPCSVAGGDGDASATPIPIDSPTAAPTNIVTNERSIALTNALAPAGVSELDATALHWLSHVDTWLPAQTFQWIERYALVVFFQKANGDSWYRNNANWKKPGVDVCNWEGVTCNANNAVLELDLRDVGLSGTMATELSLLSILTRIQTKNDPIAEIGRIPAAFTQLSNLKTLFMSNCAISKIGEEVLGMSNLDNLVLRGNRLVSTIPDELFALTKLTSLNLNECALQDQIPSGIAQLTDLEVLDVAKNALQAPFPQELTLLPKFRRFVAGQNPWSTTLPTWMGQMTALEQLYLAFSYLEGSIPSEIAQMTSLTFLTFNSNRLSGSIPPLPISLTNCKLQLNQFTNTTNKGPCTIY